jgi:hypothetical protein
MSVNVEISATSTSMPLDSLKETTLVMHRIYFNLSSLKEWYSIMKEARVMFGKNWRAQSHVRRKLNRINPWNPAAQSVWFEVPDPQFGTWCALKLAVVQATPPINKQCS